MEPDTRVYAFSEAVRRILAHARGEATTSGSSTVEPIHILRALITELPKSVVVEILRQGATYEMLSSLVAAGGVIDELDTSERPYGECSKQALAGAMVEAARQGQSRTIGPMHLIVGLLRPVDPLSLAPVQLDDVEMAFREFVSITDVVALLGGEADR